MRIIQRANEPAPWALEMQCDRCKMYIEVTAADLCHDPVTVLPFSVNCLECDVRIDLATETVPEDVRVYVAGRAALARRPGRVA